MKATGGSTASSACGCLISVSLVSSARDLDARALANDVAAAVDHLVRGVEAGADERAPAFLARNLDPARRRAARQRVDHPDARSTRAGDDQFLRDRYGAGLEGASGSGTGSLLPGLAFRRLLREEAHLDQ